MKKPVKIILAVVLVLAVAAIFFACTEKDGNNNNNTPSGDLNFEQVYAYALDAGYTGTMEELIEAFKGDSAYTIAKSMGFVGTEMEWLASLQGKAGKDGVSPSIGLNGNWWMGNTDLGITATGRDGNGISRVEQNREYADPDYSEFIIYFTNGTNTKFYLRIGKDGAKGETGNGIASVEKTDTIGLVDVYTITFTDGTTTNFNVTNGKSAYDLAVENGYTGTVTEWLASLVGEAGANGTDGKDGINGTNGKSAYELAVEKGYTGTEEEWLSSLVGEKGKDGTNGTNGTNGINGTNGTNGANGKSAYELAVENGFSGTLEQWLVSLVGTKGNDGTDGKDGEKGETGNGISKIEKTNTTGKYRRFCVLQL